MFEVIVKTLNGQDSTIIVEDESMTVEDFKKEIESILDIAPDRQRLIFQGRVLQDDQTLTACGVQGKAVHLVERAPPSRVQNPPTTTASDSNAPILDGLFSGGLGIQQAIQDINSGIRTGIMEMLRAANSHSSAEDDGGSFIFGERSSLQAREATFNRLYRQASRLLRRMAQFTLPLTSNGSHDSAPSLGHVIESANVDSAGADLPTQSDPMENDKPDINNTTTLSQNAASEQEREQNRDERSPSSYTLADLADMLNRHRQLWRSAEPYLEQWESMLIAESNSQSELAQPSDNKPVATNELTSMERDSDFVQGPSVALTCPQNGYESSTTNESVTSIWHQRFFSQISRLLHLHAHMLHLISDFSVVSVRDGGGATPSNHQPTSSSVQNADSESNAAECRSTTHENADALMESGPVPHSSIRPVRIQRVLNVPESDRNWMRARINIEAPDLNFTRITEELPPRVIRTGAPIFFGPTSLNRNRSLSTSSLHRIGSNTQNESASANTVPVTVTTASSRPVPSSHGLGRTAIIHRVDIPILSMNMINLPAGHLVSSILPPNMATSNVSNVSTMSHVSTTVSPPSYTTAMSGGVTAPQQPSHSTQLSYSGPTDPFLPCSSRHFVHEIPHRLSAVQSFWTPSSATTAATTTATTTECRTTSIDSDAPTPSTNVFTIASTSSGTTQSTTDSRPTMSSFTLPGGLSFPQQLVSLVSAATNAVVSAATAGGFGSGNSPFSVLVSPPIQFTFGSSPHPPATTASNTSANTSAHAPVPAIKPAWANTSNEDCPTNLSGMPLIFTSLLDVLMKTVWTRLGKLIAKSGLPMDNLENSSSSIAAGAHQRVSVGFLTDVISAIRAELAIYSSSTSTRNASPFPYALDHVREHFQRLLMWAESTVNSHNGRLADVLLTTIFHGSLTDSTNTLSRRFDSWLHDLNLSNVREVPDITASFVKLCRYMILSQMELWRSSPTNTGFGHTLLMTLRLAFTELLCLTDLLTAQLASAFGLTDVKNSSLSQRTQDENRASVFGFAMDFEELSEYVCTFAHSLEDNDEYAELCQAIADGLNSCIESYKSMDEVTLRAKVHHLKSAFLTFREYHSSPMMIDPVDMSSTKRWGTLEDAYDSDVNSELPFLDAHSDLPQEPNQNTTAAGYNFAVTADHGPHRLTNSRTLPDWTPKPGELPEHWSAALDPNPRSTIAMSDSPNAQMVEGWHAIIPPAWVHVVTGDISTMAHQNVASDATQVERYSDGYIAGMPAKRRKVMLNRSRSLVLSPNSLFNDCLSDALATNSHNDQVSQEQARTINDGGTDLGTDSILIPKADIELLAALKDLVSDRISSRLVTDPDFDSARFPRAHQSFLKRKDHHAPS